MRLKEKQRRVRLSPPGVFTATDGLMFLAGMYVCVCVCVCIFFFSYLKICGIRLCPKWGRL